MFVERTRPAIAVDVQLIMGSRLFRPRIWSLVLALSFERFLILFWHSVFATMFHKACKAHVSAHVCKAYMSSYYSIRDSSCVLPEAHVRGHILPAAV